MNKTKIEWTEYSWNPITGCLHGCWYCYANKLFTRFHKSFEPTFHPERLKEPYDLKKPSKIFVCSVADLFAPWTPTEWRDQVLDSMEYCPVDHTFQLLTKNPERIPLGNQLEQKDFWVGTTVTGQGDCKNIDEIKRVQAPVRFVSFEPLLNRIDLQHTYCLNGINWVIIGRLTGAKQPVDVERFRDWAHEIIKECCLHDIPVFLKNNLKPWIPYSVQEFPKVVEAKAK